MCIQRLLSSSSKLVVHRHHGRHGAPHSLLRFFSSSTGGGIRILYGSQTGTAQLFAHQLAEGLEDEGAEDVTVQGLDEEPPNEILAPGNLNLVISSCAGKGEPPDNARKFYDWVMNDPNARLPADVNFAVFGLGNESAHPNNYNVIGKRFDARLEELGGHRVKEMGLGDDGECIEGDFDEWMDEISKLITSSSSAESVDASASTDKEVVEEAAQQQPPRDEAESTTDTTRLIETKKHPTLVLDPAKGEVIRRDLFHLTGTNRFYAENTAKLKVIDNHLLTSDAGEASLHEITVSLGLDYANHDHRLKYETGDHFLVYPRNSEAIVNAYVDMLGVDPHAVISEKNNESYPHPRGITIAETLNHCIDLGAPPTPKFSRLILGRRELNFVTEIANPRRTVIDLCHQAGAKLSLEDFLYNAVPMKPRYYSIASSDRKCPDEIQLVYRPVHYMTSLGYLREGVCTSFMSHKGVMQKGGHDIACLPALISPNPSFRLPGNHKTPVLFIGGGCGVAPIRAFVQERIIRANHHDMGPATLFLGYRNPQDEVYQHLVQRALKVGALTEAEIVYSSGCDAPEQCQMLVSDLVRLKGDHVWNHVQNGGHLYMCGGARTFGAAIEAALLDIFMERGNWDFDDALKYLRGLAEEGRLAEDLAN